MRIKTNKALLLQLLLLSSYNVITTRAFSNGAGGCDGNTAAVGGFHLDTSNNRPVMSGTFTDAAIEVTLDGQVILPNTPVDVPIQQDVMISVIATDVTYLGVLVRLEAPGGVDTAGSLIPGANTQLANVCAAPVLGITHTDSSEKSMSTGTLRFDAETTDVVLDITVVFFNRADGSAYAYDQFNVNFRQAATPTDAPTATPVAASPVAVPVEPPVVAPVEPPVVAPVEPPVVAPVEPPVVAPVEPPVAAPVEPPVNAPVDVPVEPPIVVGAPVPVEPPAIIAPTDEPTLEGTATPTTTTGEPTVLNPTASPTDRKTSEPSSVEAEKIMTPNPTPSNDFSNKGMGKAMGGMMMGKKGGMMRMMGKKMGGKKKGKKGDFVQEDEEEVEVEDDRTNNFLDEYIGHHSAKSEHNKELHVEIMDLLPYEP
jgi:hypothetical protein